MLVSWLMMFLFKGDVGRDMSETSRVFFSVININSKSLGRTGSQILQTLGKRHQSNSPIIPVTK